MTLSSSKTLTSEIVSYESEIKSYQKFIIISTILVFSLIILGATAVSAMSYNQPMENFDIDGNGKFTYRPVNLSWSEYNGSNYLNLTTLPALINAGQNRTASMFAWINVKGNATSDVGGSNYIVTSTLNTRFRFSTSQEATNNSGANINIIAGESSSPIAGKHLVFSENQNWHHFGLVYTFINSSTANVSAYIDGNLSSSVLRTANEDAPSVIISAAATGSNGFFNGSIDELRFYNESVSASEVMEIYLSGRTVNYSLRSQGLIYWLSFNEANSSYINNRISESSSFACDNLLRCPTIANDGINVTTLGYQVNLSLSSLSSALIFWENNTLIDSGIDGSETISFLNNQTVYALDVFNLTEGFTRIYSPIAFTSATKTRWSINNSLSQAFGSKIHLSPNDIDCNLVSGITYTPHSGIATTFDGLTARDVCTSLTNSVGYTFSLNPSVSSNVLEFELGTTSLATRIIYILIGFLALTVLLFAVGGLMMYAKDNFDDVSTSQFIEYGVLLLIFTILIIALINYILTII